MSNFWPRTLFGRNALLLAGAISLTATFSTALIVVFLINAQLDRASSIAAELVNTVSAAAQVMEEEDRQRLIAQVSANENLQIRDGYTLPTQREVRANTIQVTYVERFKKRLKYQDNMEWLLGENRILWLRLRFGQVYYWVGAEIDTSLTPLSWFLTSVLLTIVIVTLFAILGSRAIAKPLKQLRAATDELDLESDIELSSIEGPVEIAALAQSFRSMAERLKRAETARAETLAALSHDLRTPLARLRLAVELMEADDELKESANRQVHDIDALIGQFMDYARGASGEEPARFDLAFMAADIAAQYRVAFDGPDRLEFTGHHNALRRAIINLMENAEKYGESPISISLVRDGADIVIEVRDAGNGFDPADAREMVQSFQRGDASQGVSGSGLGLAIVDQAARAHSGSISFERLSPSGFVARLRLRSHSEEQPRSANE